MEAARSASSRSIPLFAVEDRAVPGPGGDVPVRMYRPSAADRPRRRRLVSRRRLGARQHRHARQLVPPVQRRGERGRRFGRLPARARSEVPGRARRLPRGVDVGGQRTSRDVRRRPDADRDRRRQRGRQPRRGRGLPRRARRRAARRRLRSCSCIPSPTTSSTVPSMVDNADGYFLERERHAAGSSEHYTAGPERLRRLAGLAAARRPDLSGLPPALVDHGGVRPAARPG